MRIPITFKLEPEDAERLERRAKEVPKRTVSSYVRDLVRKALGKKDGHQG